MNLLITFFTKNLTAFGIVGALIGYLVLRFKGLQTDTLKQELLTASEASRDAVLAQKQADIEAAIKAASVPVEHPVLTPDEAVTKLDQI